MASSSASNLAARPSVKELDDGVAGHDAGAAPPDGPTAQKRAAWIVTAAYIASVVFPFVGMVFHDGQHRPPRMLDYWVLDPFDRLFFRRLGPFLALLPFMLQPDWTIRARWHERLALHVGSQVARIVIYVLHVMGQQYGLWMFLFGNTHVMADHVLLGMAVTACLAAELSFAWHWFLPRQLTQQPQKYPRALVGFAVLWLSASLSLLLLVSVDMFNTARWFHGRVETCVALLLGSVMFYLPALKICGRFDADKPRIE